MPSQKYPLKSWNTFSLNAYADEITIVENVEQLIDAWQSSHNANKPVLILGEGSNVLFLEDFSGHVVINRIAGIEITEQPDAWMLHVGAGENWHWLVEQTLDEGMPGLENLALIPGCVGSAPIQNIGAYGVELQQLCAYVDVVKLMDGSIQRFTAQECLFGYRESIFKHQYRQGYAIVAVGIRLPRQWVPTLSYGELKKLDPESVTPRQIFDAVCKTRRSKLPDPKVTGNAGSFFKNPIVDATTAAKLLERYPHMPHFRQDNDCVKLAAGWLIDQCDLKGFSCGSAAVHNEQALVLINQGAAKGEDILMLARLVRQRVAEKFTVWLEPEVRFIASAGEIDAAEAVA